MNYKALIDDIAELQDHYARRREAAAKPPARPPAPLAKARPPARPAASRPAPPVAKPAPRRAAAPARPVPADWLAQIKDEQRKTENSLMQSRLRAASAQVARGELSAINAAKLDIANHRAAALGIWE